MMIRSLTLSILLAMLMLAAPSALGYVRPGHPVCMTYTIAAGTDHARTVRRCIRPGRARAAGLAPPILEGDSLGVQTAPFIPGADVDAQAGRKTAEGVDRLLARPDLDGRVVLVSLGTNDPGRSAGWIAHQARRLLRRHVCVVWSEVRIDRPEWLGYPVTDEINQGLRSVHRLHLIRAVKPDAGDGVHLTPAAAKVRARRYLRAAADNC